jgi:capsular polysaccharide biosynthesis protein
VTVTELRSNVIAVRTKESYLISIIVKNSDMSSAIDIANGVAKIFVDNVKEFQDQQSAAAEEELSTERAALTVDSTYRDFEELVGKLNNSVKRPTVIIPAGLARVATPEVLDKSSGANTTRNLLLGVFLAGVLSALTVFAMEYYQNPVRSPDQLESKFGLSRLGIITKRPKRKNQTFALEAGGVTFL